VDSLVYGLGGGMGGGRGAGGEGNGAGQVEIEPTTPSVQGVGKAQAIALLET